MNSFLFNRLRRTGSAITRTMLCCNVEQPLVGCGGPSIYSTSQTHQPRIPALSTELQFAFTKAQSPIRFRLCNYRRLVFLLRRRPLARTLSKLNSPRVTGWTQDSGSCTIMVDSLGFTHVRLSIHSDVL